MAEKRGIEALFALSQTDLCFHKFAICGPPKVEKPDARRSLWEAVSAGSRSG